MTGIFRLPSEMGYKFCCHDMTHTTRTRSYALQPSHTSVVSARTVQRDSGEEGCVA